MRRTGILLDLLLLFLLTAALIQPLFRTKYTTHWESIESTFIADGRFLRDHWPHPQWQPLWYCGTRFDYIYPPVLRYGTAVLSRVWIPAKAYHIFTGLMYCLGVSGVYFLVWVMSRSRAAAWLAAAASALVSPTFLMTPIVWRSPYWAPMRLWVLTGYGEGPHVSSLAWLPFALGFAWLGIRSWRPACLALAGIFCALVALTNFYGATALAILYPVLVWSLWVTQRDRRILFRAAAIPALAYGLSAFWLTPSYLRITVENLRYVASRGNSWSVALLALAVVLYIAISWRSAAGKASRDYTVFLSGCLLLMGLNVLGYLWFGFRVIGQPHRLISELDLLLCLAGAELVRRLWMWPSRTPRVLAVVIVALSAWESHHYLRHAWELFPAEADYKQRVEYRMSDWMNAHMPQARTFVAGSIRFWWDAWHDLAQTGGGSEQGVMNPHTMEAQWEIVLGAHPELGGAWLQALGADAVIMNGPRSREMYHDFKFPDKFAGVLPVLDDDGQGDVIYGVPRRYASLARVVDRARMRAVEPVEQTNLDSLRAYNAVVEGGPDSPTTTVWRGTDEIDVHARVGAGQSVLVETTYDRAWHAYAEGKALPVYQDRGADFSVIDAPPGEHDIRLVFEMPLENRIGWLLTALSLGMVAALVTQPWRRRRYQRGRPTNSPAIAR